MYNCRLMTTREFRDIALDIVQEQIEETMKCRGNVISDRAREILSIGSADNPREENTIIFLVEREEAHVFRLFRRRHLGGEDPMVAAHRWVRHVKAHCVSGSGNLRFTDVPSGVDGGSVHVKVSGKGIFALEEM